MKNHPGNPCDFSRNPCGWAKFGFCVAATLLLVQTALLWFKPVHIAIKWLINLF